MLYLASSSSSRARLLKQNGFEFSQLQVSFDESSVDKNLKPEIYVQKVLELKEKLFFKSKEFKALKANFDEKNDSIVFADSIVSVDDIILTKAHNDEEALEMLSLQNAKKLSIISALSISSHKKITALSLAKLTLAPFEEKELRAFIASKAYLGKAGCVECEGFHKKYILKLQGELSTALGLDISILKAYL
ncbi:septum formation inhibitor Maf [Campylobacter sp. MIT 12-8780]|uniref:septum formation inhibitor Maf n=1 Tax=unclassified Campylobacter TaxID=2593542 RepID=UPI00115E845A|nr:MULTISPECIES: septum formation inhibitor Maf [unclassified Campylobacter]NDJ26457.1 septum formation inhibitor Maf [Campylobacter sp. MIT 19-121]TQR43029.1 septum formation inhibitor Maf [Campylobacter sp. MIT 12-8780]